MENTLVINSAVLIGLGIVVYLVAAELMGKYWALLPTFIVIGNKTVIGELSLQNPALPAALATFIAVGCIAEFLEKPARASLIASGITLGIALAINPEALLLVPLGILFFSIHFIASIIRDWKETDPAMRKNRFYVRTMHYLHATIVIGAVAIAVLYLAIIVQPVTPAPQSNNFATNWLLGNVVLRPFGMYAQTVGAYAQTLPNIPIASPTLALAAIICFGVFLGIQNAIKKIGHAADELGVHYTEFIFYVASISFIVVHGGTLTTGIFFLLLGMTSVVAAQAIKTWLYATDPTLYRNMHLEIALTSNTKITMTIKWIVVVGLLLWYATDLVAYLVR